MKPGSDRPGSSCLHRALALAPMAVGACVLVVIAWCGVQRALAFAPASAGVTIIDFDVFHLVGRLTLDGRVADAYRPATLERLEAELSPDARSIPFAYPPPFTLLMAVLASLPVGAAYALFTIAGFALLAGALRFIAPSWFWPAMLTMTPAIFINVAVGQNGMLTAGLAGIAAGFAVRHRGGAAGVLAGLLAALKPQSCLALPLLFVGQRAWRPLLAMAATAAVLGGISLALLGLEVLPASLEAMSRTGESLAQGRFQLHRMTSVYACLRSFGLAASLSMTLHVAAALAIVGGVGWAARSIRDARAASGLIMMAGCFVSPYFYDYDLPLAGLGLSLALPALARHGTWWRAATPMAVLALAQSAGLVETLALPTRLSFGAPILLICLVTTASLLTHRAPITVRQARDTRTPFTGPGLA